jgi:outer membrane lipoprotein-sorting protein
MKKWLFIILFASLPGFTTAQNPSGEEILVNVDKNLVVEQAVSVASMTIHARSGSRTITSKSWTKGRDSVFVEYLSPAREKGKKMLKLGDKLWNYTPEPNDRIITISGHLLRQSVMGSDLSYEDMMENHRLTEMYDAVVDGKEDIDGRSCWVLTLTAKKSDISYQMRKVWIDADRWLPLKEERFAKSGKLLKTTTIDEVFQIGDRWYPKHMTFKDMLSRGDGTEYTIESIDFDAEIPDYLLTKAALRQ